MRTQWMLEEELEVVIRILAVLAVLLFVPKMGFVRLLRMVPSLYYQVREHQVRKNIGTLKVYMKIERIL